MRYRLDKLILIQIPTASGPDEEHIFLITTLTPSVLIHFSVVVLTHTYVHNMLLVPQHH